MLCIVGTLWEAEAKKRRKQWDRMWLFSTRNPEKSLDLVYNMSLFNKCLTRDIFYVYCDYGKSKKR